MKMKKVWCANKTAMIILTILFVLALIGLILVVWHFTAKLKNFDELNTLAGKINDVTETLTTKKSESIIDKVKQRFK